MNETSASRADAPLNMPARAATRRTALVWDAPVRVFHWLMVLSFAGAYLTADGERWRLLHVTLGYTLAGLVVFRLLWGLIGTRHARFSSFVRGPSAALRYLRSLLSGRPEHHVGHNPAGALVIVALLAISVAVAASGWGVYNDLGGEWFEEVHEAAANLMLALVGVHLAGVLVGSWLHRENLVGAMISGRKAGAPNEGARSAWRTVAALVVAAVLGFWWWQWQSAPPGGRAGMEAVAGSKDRGHAHDDD